MNYFNECVLWVSNIKFKKIRSIQNIYSCENQIVCFSKKFLKIEQEIKYFLRSRMYDNKNVIVKNNKGKNIIKNLFYIIKKIEHLLKLRILYNMFSLHSSNKI